MSLREVGFRFPAHDQPLFSALTHDFSPGTITALTGPSGSGKSTLLSLIAGSLAPTTGTVHCPADVYWVLQQAVGITRRSALDHVRLPFLARGAGLDSARASARDTLTDFGLDHLAHRPFHTLSGGEAQRVMLARAVAADPPVILVDEPTAQLDRVTSELVAGVLDRLRCPHRIVIVATHDPIIMARASNTLAVDDHAGVRG